MSYEDNFNKVLEEMAIAIAKDRRRIILMNFGCIAPEIFFDYLPVDMQAAQSALAVLMEYANDD